MSSAYPVTVEPGVIQEIERAFVEPLRRPLAGFALFAGKERRVAHWGIETLKWREVAAMSDAVISMDIPPFRADSGTVTSKTVEIPIFTKDIFFSGRALRQAREYGLDTVAAREAGRALAENINKFLLFGSGTNQPGDATGLLNDAGQSAAISGGSWATAATINTALYAGIQQALVNTIDGSDGFTLIMNPADSAKFGVYIANTPRRFADDIPGQITRVLYDSDVPALECYLVSNAPGYYFSVSPQNEGELKFGLGTATQGFVNLATTQLTKMDEMFQTYMWRGLNIVSPAIVRPKAVQKITFTA